MKTITSLSKQLAIVAGALLLSNCSNQPQPAQGYIDANLTYISATLPGQLQQLSVSAGESVKKGQVLFRLADMPQMAALKNADGLLLQAKANLANAKIGSRPTELAQISANIHKAEADVIYQQKQLQRFDYLVAKNQATMQQLDLAKQNLASAKASLANFRAQYANAKLPARENIIKANQALVASSEASVAKALWDLQQKTVDAPEDGSVYDTYYNVGEQVNASAPVLSLLTPKNKRLIFFVSERNLSHIKLQQLVTLHCDDCQPSLKARVNYIAEQPEYTPPVIYSQQSRQKLVYEIRAQLIGQAQQLHPGEPVDVWWQHD